MKLRTVFRSEQNSLAGSTLTGIEIDIHSTSYAVVRAIGVKGKVLHGKSFLIAAEDLNAVINALKAAKNQIANLNADEQAAEDASINDAQTFYERIGMSFS